MDQTQSVLNAGLLIRYFLTLWFCMRPHPSSFVLCCISIGLFVPVVCSEAQLYNGSALLHMYTCFSSIILFVTLNFASSVSVHYRVALLCVCVCCLNFISFQVGKYSATGFDLNIISFSPKFQVKKYSPNHSECVQVIICC